MGNEKSSANIYKLIDWKIMIPIMLFTVFNSAFNAFSPILVEIQNAFPGASVTMIQMLMTLPSLMSIPMGLFAGVLCSYFYKKHLVLASMVFMFVGGILPLFVHGSITAPVIASLLIGIGQGLMINIAIAITAEFFPGEATGTAMGLKQAAGSIGIAALTVATGFLARSAWYHAYAVYLLLIPVFILTVIFLPKGKKDIKLVSKETGFKGITDMVSVKYIWYVLMCCLGTVFSFAFYTNIAMSIINSGLGDAAAVGVATAWNSVIVIVIGIIFGYLLKAFKKFAFVAAFAIQAISYLMIAGAGSLTVVAIAGMIYGFGNGIQMIVGNVYIADVVPQKTYSMAISITMALISVSITLSPVIVNGLVGVLGKQMNGTDGLFIAGIGFIVMAVLDCLFAIFVNKDSQIGK